MDISPQYINQCRKAEEIQKTWRPGPQNINEKPWYSPGDWYVWEEDEEVYCLGTGEKLRGKFDYIWLPTQSQLQKILYTIRDKYSTKCAYGLQISFIEYLEKTDFGKIKRENDIIPVDIIRTYSIEQLWLCFVMKEKFNKIWYEKEWILNKS